MKSNINLVIYIYIVMFLKEDSFVERIVYRIIKKHIAGTTMNSALNKAQKIDKEKMLTSIMFLSANADNKMKARYITTTYTELIRRISRLGLKASVHIPIGQIGSEIDEDTSANNLSEILVVGNRCGVFVWLALSGNPSEEAIAERFKDAKGFGIAVPHDKANETVMKWGTKATKLIFDGKGKRKESVVELLKEVDVVVKRTNTAVLSSPPENLVKNLIINSRYKKTVVIEFNLGYSNRKIKKLASKGVQTSINMPFGKDWTTYAMDIVPEGNMHFIVGKLLKEEEKRVV